MPKQLSAENLRLLCPYTVPQSYGLWGMGHGSVYAAPRARYGHGLGTVGTVARDVRLSPRSVPRETGDRTTPDSEDLSAALQAFEARTALLLGQGLPELSSHRAAVEGLVGVADGISSISDDEIPGVIAGVARLQALLSLTLTAQSHTAVLSSRGFLSLLLSHRPGRCGGPRKSAGSSTHRAHGRGNSGLFWPLLGAKPTRRDVPTLVETRWTVAG